MVLALFNESDVVIVFNSVKFKVTFEFEENLNSLASSLAVSPVNKIWVFPEDKLAVIVVAPERAALPLPLVASVTMF